MRTLSLLAVVALFLGMAYTPALLADNAKDKPEVVCPNSDCKKDCCQRDEKNRMVCKTADCGKEKQAKQEKQEGMHCH